MKCLVRGYRTATGVRVSAENHILKFIELEFRIYRASRTSRETNEYIFLAVYFIGGLQFS